MKIGLIGTGRLGLCFSLLVERAGYSVLASDNREDYIKDLQKRVVGTTEPDVHDLLWSSKNIEFTTDNERVIRECDIIFTLVATPSLEDGSYDVSNVDDVVSDIQKIGWKTSLTGKSLVVGCTTNPVIVILSKEDFRKRVWMCITIQSLLHKDLLLKI